MTFLLGWVGWRAFIESCLPVRLLTRFSTHLLEIYLLLDPPIGLFNLLIRPDTHLSSSVSARLCYWPRAATLPFSLSRLLSIYTYSESRPNHIASPTNEKHIYLPWVERKSWKTGGCHGASNGGATRTGILVRWSWSSALYVKSLEVSDYYSIVQVNKQGRVVDFFQRTANAQDRNNEYGL